MTSINNKEENRRTGSTVSRVVIIFAVLVVVYLVFATAWTVHHRLQENREFIGCLAGLRQIGFSMLVYAKENDGRYPDPNRWCDSFLDYFKAKGITPADGFFVCPGAEKALCNYAMNPNAAPNSPADVVLMFDTKGGWNQHGGPELLTFENHRGRFCSVLFADGQVRMIEPDEVSQLEWRTDE